MGERRRAREPGRAYTAAPMTSPATMIVPPARPSASVLLLRETAGRLEVLLQRRPATLWFGGTWVFPGGSVDPCDGDFAREPAQVLRRAAVRECLEEAGVALDPDPAAGELLGWSRWITPGVRERRFDTWFFVAALPAGAIAAGADGETVESGWFEPETALEAAASARMLLMGPTRLNLLDLQLTHALHGGLARMLAAERSRPIVPILPRLVGPPEARIAVYPWDPDYDALPGEGITLRDAAPAHLRRLPSRLALGAAGNLPRPTPR
jgi:8-oxo-dGTP pyrophosphatase MutT (NUDIX family)